MELSADTGLRLAIFTAEPGSRSEQALDLLASWSRHARPPAERARGRGRRAAPVTGFQSVPMRLGGQYLKNAAPMIEDWGTGPQ